MLWTYTNGATTPNVPSNVAIPFNTNGVQTGCTATHEPGSATINLNKPGFYHVSFNGEGTAVTAAGEINVQLVVSSELIVGAESTTYSTGVTDPQSLSFNTIVQVAPNCPAVNTLPTYLTFMNNGIETNFYNVSVVVTKLA